MTNPRAAAIIPAAGSGTRMNTASPKQYLELAGTPVLVHTVLPFTRCPFIDQIIVAVPADKVEQTRDLIGPHLPEKPAVRVIAGGIRRQDSVLAGLQAIQDDIEIVLVHDGVRPLVTEDLIESCYEQAAQSGAAIAAVEVKDTLKRGDAENRIAATVDRSGLWQAQTPQAARRELLQQGFAAAGGRDVTDEAGLLELAGIPVAIVKGAETNLKITRPEDLELARTIMNARKPALRIGHGFDAHRFGEDRKLVLGGVEIDYHLGLLGHSDADVVAHALGDAILGAAGAGDLGRHFPDSSDEYKDISSLILLDRIMAVVQADGLALGNCDITVVCQEPRLGPHFETMRQTLAKHCLCSPEQINIKATTTEKMGYTGRLEGISCHAVVILEHLR